MYDELQRSPLGRRRLGVWTDAGELRAIELIDAILTLDKRMEMIEAMLAPHQRDALQQAIETEQQIAESKPEWTPLPKPTEEPSSDSEPVSRPGE